jgi:hypothetical protein
VAVFAVNSAFASFTSGEQGGAALAIPDVESDTMAMATRRGRDLICVLRFRLEVQTHKAARPEPIRP